MHEFSLVQSLLSLIERYASENGARKVTKVVVKVGVLSGVEPYLLKTAFDTFKEATVARDSELIIETEKLKIECMDCGKVSEREEPKFECPFCKSLNVKAEGSDEFLLKSLEMECDEEEVKG